MWGNSDALSQRCSRLPMIVPRTGDNAFEGGHGQVLLVASMSFPTVYKVLCRLQAALFKEWSESHGDAEVARAGVTSFVVTSTLVAARRYRQLFILIELTIYLTTADK